MKKSTPVKLMMLTTLLIFMVPGIYSQITTAVFYTEADLSLGSGTGQALGDFQSRNFGIDGSIEMCNFDDDEDLMSYFEGWAKFDLTTLGDSIPEGQSVLYAEVEVRVTNNTGQGAIVHHLKDIDNWKEGNGKFDKLDDTGEGLTWDAAQAFDYENEANSTLLFTGPTSWVTGSRYQIDITSAVEYEMGAEGNKILTLRFSPSIAEYDPVTSPKQWLGLYTRDSPWELQPGDEFNMSAAHIIFYIGPPQPTVFSDIESFGDLDNYDVIPSGFKKWDVVEDEGDTRLRLMERPPPVNTTPGGLAIYRPQTYTDFDITMKAKALDAESSRTDLLIAFGHVSATDYAYMLFTAEAKNGFYTVDETGKTVVGDLVETPAFSGGAFHDYRIVRAGNTVTAYVDGTEYHSLTDPLLGAEGKIGMGSYNDTIAFDNFKEGEGGEPISVQAHAQASFTLFPNPARDHIDVRSEQGMERLEIINSIGQQVRTIESVAPGLITIHTSGLRSGVYFLRIFGSEGMLGTEKFIIK